jgi:hypothetical protein
MSDITPRVDPIDPMGDSTNDPAPVSTGFQIMLVLAALGLVILIAGVPGLDPVAGNGSEDLRHGWAARRQAVVEQGYGAGEQSSGPVDRTGRNR